MVCCMQSPFVWNENTDFAKDLVEILSNADEQFATLMIRTAAKLEAKAFLKGILKRSAWKPDALRAWKPKEEKFGKLLFAQDIDPLCKTTALGSCCNFFYLVFFLSVCQIKGW